MTDNANPSPLDLEQVREAMLKEYPAKTRKKRARQILLNDPAAPPEIAANTRTVPGIMTQRGCTYAGCRGVVMGPIYDLLQITHGPIGCGYYAWMTRRNLARPREGAPNYMQYSMYTEMQEDQVVASGQALVVTDIAKDEHFKHRSPPGPPEGDPGPVTAFLYVPIKHGNDILGTLSLERVTPPGVSFSSDLRLLTLIALVLAQAVHLRQSTRKKLDELMHENSRLQHQLANGLKPENMIGNSKGMQSVYRHIDQVSTSDTTVLIRGESGVGKELVARALHQQSHRANKAFVKFNCAALPESIIESELFGHEKGALAGGLRICRRQSLPSTKNRSPPDPYLARCRRKALPMTTRSERPIAAAHSTGLIRPAMASGIAAAL
jgi:hypothetical protein